MLECAEQCVCGDGEHTKETQVKIVRASPSHIVVVDEVVVEEAAAALDRERVLHRALHHALRHGR